MKQHTVSLQDRPVHVHLISLSDRTGMQTTPFSAMAVKRSADTPMGEEHTFHTSVLFTPAASTEQTCCNLQGV